jgi:transposase InsO family protein
MQEEHSIADLCAALGVSRSGYHAWVTRTPGPRAQADATLWPLIEQAYKESRQTYGSPRIRQWLGRHGQKCSRHRVARLMRGHRMKSQTKRRFRVALTDSNHDLPIAPNRLRDTKPPAQRDAVWVADITYVDTAEGWLYVAGVLDRHTRRCVGWAME